MRRGFGLIALAAAMTAGCATSAMTAAVVTRTSAGGPARPASPSAPASSPAAGPSARQRAEAAAAGLLAEFVPPPGARRLAGPPDLPGGWEQHPQSILVSNSMVDQAAFWEAPGDPQSLLSWEQARLTGKRFTLGDADFGPPSWDREFDLPAAGPLTSRDLIVEVVGAGHGQTAIRLDADIAWQPSRPPGDLVPNAARVVTISELASGNPQATRPPAPVTITDPTVAGRLAALVDSLPVSPLNNQAVSCPAAFGISLQLAFRTRTGGPVAALVQTDQPCGMVDFTVTGQRLIGLENNTSVDRQILAIAALPWKLPNPLRARTTTRSVLGRPPRPLEPPPVVSGVAVRLPGALMAGTPGTRLWRPVGTEAALILRSVSGLWSTSRNGIPAQSPENTVSSGIFGRTIAGMATPYRRPSIELLRPTGMASPGAETLWYRRGH